MIYIDLNKSTQVVYVPRNGAIPGAGDSLKLTAVSTSDRTAVEFLVASSSVTGYLLRLVVGLPGAGIFEGEWEYTLTLVSGSGESTTSKDIAYGLMKMTGDTAEVLAYNRETKYKQYGE